MFTHCFHPDLIEQPVVLPDGTTTSFLRHADERDGSRTGEGVGAVCRRGDGKIPVAWQWNLGPAAVVAEFPGGGVGPVRLRSQPFGENSPRSPASGRMSWCPSVRRCPTIGGRVFSSAGSSAATSTRIASMATRQRSPQRG